MYPVPAGPARCATTAFYLRSGFFDFGLTEGEREDLSASSCHAALFSPGNRVHVAVEELRVPSDLPYTGTSRLAATVRGCRQMYGRRQCPIFLQRDSLSKATSS